MYIIENEAIRLTIDAHGAEMKSLIDKATGTEYLWCGDARFWGRTSPVLFPFVGGVNHKEYTAKGNVYSMGQHGFARDMDFTVISETTEEIWFRFESTPDTLAKYPYEFQLELGYALKERSVSVLWRVINPANETMYFSIGGHPAFMCPIKEGTKQTDYLLKIGEGNQVISTDLVEGLASNQQTTYQLENGILPVTESLFDKDALVIEGNQALQVALLYQNQTPYLTVTFDAPLFGIWSPPGKNAPFICIEPWFGRCDGADFHGTIEERKWGNVLDAGQTWQKSYTISI